jgi:hypothetical protein
VAFESERSLLLLHARSLALHLDPQLLASVIVIDNSARGFRPEFVDRLRRAYGPFGDRLRVVRRAEVGSIPRGIGWYVQQVLKLQIVNHVETERYVVLDVKNLAVAPISADFFADPSGRPRGIAYTYESHPLRPGLERVLTYVGVDPAPYVERFTATVTPFVFDSATVRALIEWIEERSGRPFADEFMQRELLEFFLYSGYLVAQGAVLDEIFSLDRISCPTIWPRGANLASVRTAIEQVDIGGAPFVSVHRKALAVLDEAAVSELEAFWIRKGIFTDEAEFRDYLRDFRREFVREERLRKVRELESRGRRKLRQLLRRVDRRRADA